MDALIIISFLSIWVACHLGACNFFESDVNTFHYLFLVYSVFVWFCYMGTLNFFVSSMDDVGEKIFIFWSVSSSKYKVRICVIAQVVYCSHIILQWAN